MLILLSYGALRFYDLLQENYELKIINLYRCIIFVVLQVLDCIRYAIYIFRDFKQRVYNVRICLKNIYQNIRLH